jgi:aspartyl-tRNA(Asn)/glutamyl-tRNA(Gln) amidotransferase subunit A
MLFRGEKFEPAQLAQCSATDIGRHLAQNRGGALALAEYCLAHIEAQTSLVFLKATRPRALSEARAADARLAAGRPLSPLDGVPVAWKDLVDMASEPTTAASELLRNAPPARTDAAVVQNASRAGMVSLGKLNLAEFAYSALGQNPHFGTPLNPNSTTPHAPGGSSSGAGVAVAAHIVPVALGTDTAGSVRIPASYCGVTGFKTSEGKVPKTGMLPLSRTKDTIGPLAQTVQDCALAFDVFRGVPAQLRHPAVPEQLSIVVAEGLTTTDLSPAVAAAFEASLTRLEMAGVRVRKISLPALDDAAAMLAERGSIVAAEAFSEHREMMNSPYAIRMDQRIRARIEIGRAMSAEDLVTLWAQRSRGAAEIRAALDGAFLVMPTTPNTAPAIADFEGDDAAFKRLNLTANRNTSIGSFYDLPGLAIPNGRDQHGLPTSFLISACSGDDDQLLRAGLALEQFIRNETDK